MQVTPKVLQAHPRTVLHVAIKKVQMIPRVLTVVKRNQEAKGSPVDLRPHIAQSAMVDQEFQVTPVYQGAREAQVDL